MISILLVREGSLLEIHAAELFRIFRSVEQQVRDLPFSILFDECEVIVPELFARTGGQFPVHDGRAISASNVIVVLTGTSVALKIAIL